MRETIDGGESAASGDDAGESRDGGLESQALSEVELGVLSRSIAHDLCNTLLGIDMLASLTADGANGPRSLTENVELLRRETERASLQARKLQYLWSPLPKPMLKVDAVDVLRDAWRLVAQRQNAGSEPGAAGAGGTLDGCEICLPDRPVWTTVQPAELIAAVTALAQAARSAVDCGGARGARLEVGGGGTDGGTDGLAIFSVSVDVGPAQDACGEAVEQLLTGARERIARILPDARLESGKDEDGRRRLVLRLS